MYVGMYVCMYVSMYVCMYVYNYLYWISLYHCTIKITDIIDIIHVKSPRTQHIILSVICFQYPIRTERLPSNKISKTSKINSIQPTSLARKEQRPLNVRR